MGAGGGGGAVAAVRRFVDTVRKYNEVRSVEDGVRDGLGEGVVEAEADELALPPDEGDHQHAISDAISMQSTTSWHSHLGSLQLRAVDWRPSHPRAARLGRGRTGPGKRGCSSSSAGLPARSHAAQVFLEL